VALAVTADDNIMWTFLLNLVNGSALQMLAAATSLPGLFTLVVKKYSSDGTRSALQALFMVGTVMFALVVMGNLYYGFQRVFNDERDKTNANCVLHYGCGNMTEANKNQPAQKALCDGYKNICERNPWDRTFERLSDVFPTWTDLSARVQDKFLLLCVIGLFANLFLSYFQPKLKNKKRDFEKKRIRLLEESVAHMNARDMGIAPPLTPGQKGAI
jgi:hypothetical protein